MSRAALRLLDAVRKGRESDVKEMLESSTWGGDGGDGGGGGAEEEEQVRDAALLWAAVAAHRPSSHADAQHHASSRN